MTVTAVVHHKGGIGSTMILQLLAAELASRGRRVLAVDSDPQGNLTRRMGYQEYELDDRLTTAEVVQAAAPAALREAMIPCQWAPSWAENITLVPARVQLENRVAEAGVPGAWRRLYHALAEARRQFDDVLIDTPPSLGHMFDLASCAADGLLLPSAPTYDSMRGAQRIMDLVNDRERRISLGLRAQVLGVVINGRRPVTNHNDRIDQMIESWGSLVWSPHITLRNDVADADERAEPPQLTTGKAGPMIRMAAKDLTDRYLTEVTGQDEQLVGAPTRGQL